jgi:hypothetical protein
MVPLGKRQGGGRVRRWNEVARKAGDGSEERAVSKGEEKWNREKNGKKEEKSEGRGEERRKETGRRGG